MSRPGSGPCRRHRPGRRDGRRHGPSPHPRRGPARGGTRGRLPPRQRVVRNDNVKKVPPPVAPAQPTTHGMLRWVALGVVYVLWGSSYLSIRYVILTIPPLLAGGMRFLVGGTLLGLI